MHLPEKSLAINKGKRMSEGAVSPSEAEKSNIFKLILHILVHTFCHHFTENPSIISNKMLAILMPIPPTFPVLMPLGGVPPLKLKNVFLKLNLCDLVHTF